MRLNSGVPAIEVGKRDEATASKAAFGKRGKPGSRAQSLGNYRLPAEMKARLKFKYVAASAS